MLEYQAYTQNQRSGWHNNEDDAIREIFGKRARIVGSERIGENTRNVTVGEPAPNGWGVMGSAVITYYENHEDEES